MSVDRSSWPTHLRDDAPTQRCALPRGHAPAYVHADRELGEWRDTALEFATEEAGPDSVDFLRQRLDEDERAALAALSGTGDPDDLPAWRRETRWRSDYERVHALRPNVPEEIIARSAERRPGANLRYELLASIAGPSPEAAFHIARHDPARVLRQVEAMRRILDATDCDEGASPDAHGLALMVRQDLASMFSDHPEYQEGWTT